MIGRRALQKGAYCSVYTILSCDVTAAAFNRFKKQSVEKALNVQFFYE